MDSLDAEQHKTLISSLRKWLGKDGLDFFREMVEKHGTISPVISIPYGDTRTGPQKFFPHSVHLREGMQVRNFLRSLPETKSWNDHDYDDMWVELVAEALQ